MSPIDHLARIAQANADRISGPKLPSPRNATVTGYDKATGLYIVNRAGALELAESATNGGLKLGAEAPSIQGKVFATPHTPRPIYQLSVPHISKPSQEHKVFLACLPYADSWANGIPWFTNQSMFFGGNNSFFPTNSAGANLRETFVEEYDKASDGYTVQTQRSLAYKMLAEVIDFVFPQADGSKLSGDCLVPFVNTVYNTRTYRTSHNTSIESIMYRGNYLIASDIYSKRTVLRFGARVTTSIVFLDIKRAVYENQVGTTPYGFGMSLAFKQLLGSAFERKEKTLIIVRPQGFTFHGYARILSDYDLMYAIGERYDLDANVNNWRTAAVLNEELMERLLGVSFHGMGFVSDGRSQRGGQGPIGRRGTYGDKNKLSKINVDYTGIDTDYGLDYWENSTRLRHSNALAFGNLAFTPADIVQYSSSHDGRYPDQPLGPNGTWTSWSTYTDRPYGDYSPIVGHTAVNFQSQKQFENLITSLGESVGSEFYVRQNGVYTGINELDVVQPLYGDSLTPHFWIKGISKESIDAIDPVAEANALGIAKVKQYICGIDSGRVPPRRA